MKRKVLAPILSNVFLTLGLLVIVGGNAHAQTTVFTPGQLAVMQLGDGGPGRGFFAPSDLFGSRQNQIFIDQFDPAGINQTNPSVRVAIPTNGPGAMLINGNAGTEGNLTLAGDKSVLAFTSYQGDILSIATGQSTAPSNLSYDRGIGTVDAFTNYANPYRGSGWYGVATGKTNPRGVATDGAGNFWGCGNGYGSLYFSVIDGGPLQFQNIALTSCAKVINNALYASVKNSESVNLYPAGVYSFVDFYNNPVAYPNTASFLHLEIQADPAHTSVIGFDINPDATVAYLVDNSVTGAGGGGIQKYVKSGLAWKMAYNLAIPGYYSLTSGTMTNAASTNTLVGCFSVAVDWSGSYPIVYATTTDAGVTSGSPYYGNRVIRIDDTNTVTSGITIIATTNILKTVVKPWGNGTSQLTNVVYKSVTFTPDLRPVITNNPANWSAVVGDNVSFSVGASSPYSLNYQWLKSGTNLPGETSTTLTLNSVGLSYSNTTYQCVVTNNYGAVTSSVATLLVSSVPIPLTLGTVQNITNFVGNNQTITAKFISGTDPKGGYQWYLNGNALSDGPTGNGSTLGGTATGKLNITQAAINDAGVYSVVVTNIAGSVSNTVANFYTPYAPPVMVQPPIALTTFFGRTVTDTASAYGQLLSYRWYTSTNKTTAILTGLTALLDGGDYSGTTTASLQISGAGIADVTNYVIVISNPGGSITSAPVALTLSTAPPHTFVSYTNAGQSYSQNFNALPIPGLSSAEGANPLHLAISMTNIPAMLTNGNPSLLNTLSADVTYSVDNPMDFGYPVIPSGAIGGLGLSNKMDGWYGWAQNVLVFAAGKGDQSQGAVVDNGGNYYADGTPLTGITNRALGLVATTKTGPVAMGAAFINKTTNTLNVINLSYTGELWRNNPNQQPLIFGYIIDPTGTNSTFHPDTMGIVYVSSLDVKFPTSPGTTVNDGTLAINQTNLTASGLAIADWTPGAALWLVWQGQTLGSAQDVAIDNLSLSAGTAAAPTVTTQPAVSITPVGATLKAAVNPNTFATTYYFQYGTTISYGSFSTTNNLAVGFSSVNVSNLVGGLQPGTTYHYQALANNSMGTSLGGDATFTTVAINPPKLGGVAYTSGGGSQFSFTNFAGVNFTVLGTTNMALPLSQWQNLGSPTESPAGQYHFTDPQATNKPQQFYILRQP